MGVGPSFINKRQSLRSRDQIILESANSVWGGRGDFSRSGVWASLEIQAIARAGGMVNCLSGGLLLGN